MTASSTGRRNTGVKSLCWGFVFQGLTWSFVELTGGPVQFVGKYCPQQTIGVLIGTALPASALAPVDQLITPMIARPEASPDRPAHRMAGAGREAGAGAAHLRIDQAQLQTPGLTGG